MRLKPSFLALLAAVFLLGCSSGPDNSGYRPPRTPTVAATVPPATLVAQAATGQPVGGNVTDGNAPGIPELQGDIQTNPSGLRYIDQVVGAGPAPITGSTVVVNYSGWLTNGTMFDSSFGRGEPLSFPIGTGQVIQGWDEGVAGMRVGGKRRLIIPPQMAYGDRGAGNGAIPPGATLIFDVDLISIN